MTVLNVLHYFSLESVVRMHNPESEPRAVAPGFGCGRNWKEEGSNPKPSVRRPNTLTAELSLRDLGK